LTRNQAEWRLYARLLTTTLGQWIDTLRNRQPKAWLFPSEAQVTPLSRDNLWRRNLLPKLEEIGLEWATFQVMRRTFATLSKQVGVDAHTRSAQMGNTVDVNENEYAFSRLEDKLAAVRKLENTVTVIQSEDDQEIPGVGACEGLREIG
jgi:integrase